MSVAEKHKKFFGKAVVVLAIAAAVIFNPYFTYMVGVAACISSFGFDDYFFDLSDFDYDDQWILGNTLENVKERYGEFDTEWIVPYQRVGYYLGMGRPSDMDGVFRFYYYMDHDSDGVITKVYVSYDPRGG